jgi:hypothetical protein
VANLEKLAQIKRLLEELKANLDEEEENLKYRRQKLSEAIGVLDQILGKQSFFVASDLLHLGPTKSDSQDLHSILETSSDEKTSKETKEDYILRSEETGIELANIHIDKNEITITPIPEKVFKLIDPELQEFFIGKVMKEVQKEDKKIIIKINEEKGFIKSIFVSNFASERQINRILGAIRWVFTKILQKS